MIDETCEGINWSKSKQMPVKVMRGDYLERGDDGWSVSGYKEYFVITHFYNNDFNIFEALIRQKILTREIEISDSQIERICNPVLSDNNKNLLHHLSYRRIFCL